MIRVGDGVTQVRLLNSCASCPEKKCKLDVQKKLELPMKRFCDPNGIRTRVTAVKGRCPRPLDDRVRSAGNIGGGVIGASQTSAPRQAAFASSYRVSRGYGGQGSERSEYSWWTNAAVRAVAPWCSITAVHAFCMRRLRVSLSRRSSASARLSESESVTWIAPRFATGVLATVS